MSLASIIEDVEAREKTLTVFNPEPDGDIVSRLSSYFETQNVRVESERTSSGRPTAFAVLNDEDRFLAAISQSKLEELLDGGALDSDNPGIDDTEYHELLQHLKETTFTSYDKVQMIDVSREIEDRAWREGSGELHAGFQHASVIESQADTYRDLARSNLSIHVYAAPDGTEIDIDGVDVRLVDSEEIATVWFVLFDGDGRDIAKTALLAEERSPGSYYGFWTYDPVFVDRIIDHLQTNLDQLTHH